MLQVSFNPLEKDFKFGQIIKSGLEEKLENSQRVQTMSKSLAVQKPRQQNWPQICSIN